MAAATRVALAALVQKVIERKTASRSRSAQRSGKRAYLATVGFTS